MCDERERLIGYVYDECDPSERKAIEAHLEDCGTCRDEIGGLRGVRQDLLGWAVTAHEPVWRPLVAVPVAPWWRQVPAWAMAAAAGVMFLVGAAGGVVTHALMKDEARAPIVAAAPAAPGVQMTPIAVTERRLSEVEERIVEKMRAELAKRARVSPMAPAGLTLVSSRDQLRQELTDLIDARLTAGDDRQLKFFNAVNNDIRGIRTRTDSRLDRLDKLVEGLLQSQVSR
jgi:hypothetical protein